MLSPPVRRLVRSAQAGAWPEDEAEGSVELAFEQRHRRRLRVTTDGGEAVLVDLPRAVPLVEGSGLAFDGGGWVRVRAAAEDVLEVRGRDPAHLVRLAWHAGNRRLPIEVAAGGTLLRLRYDHVIETMLQGLGATCERARAPFQPEGGAHALGHRHHDDRGG